MIRATGSTTKPYREGGQPYNAPRSRPGDGLQEPGRAVPTARSVETGHRKRGAQLRRLGRRHGRGPSATYTNTQTKTTWAACAIWPPLVSGTLKNLLKAQEQKQLDFEQLTEYLNRNTTDRDVLASGSYGSSLSGGGAFAAAGGFVQSKIEDVRGVDHEQSRHKRQRKLELRIEELTAEVERARRTSDMFDEEVVKEVADFERIKRIEFKRQFGALAAAHMDFYSGVIDVWERYVGEMEKDGVLAA